MTAPSEEGSTARDPDETRRAVMESDYRSYLKESEDRLRFQIEFAQAALRNLLLVNGGAILALLTALGNSRLEHDDRGVFWSFVWFGCGLSTALLAYFCAFYSQLHFYNSASYKTWNTQAQLHALEAQYDHVGDFSRGNLALFLGAMLAFLSLAMFVTGSFVALEALLP